MAGVPGSKEFAGQFIPPPSQFHVAPPLQVTEIRRPRRGRRIGIQQALGHQARLYQRQAAEQFEFEASDGADTSPSPIFLKAQGTQWQPGNRFDPIAQSAQPQPQELGRNVQVALRGPPERQEPRPMPHRKIFGSAHDCTQFGLHLLRRQRLQILKSLQRCLDPG